VDANGKALPGGNGKGLGASNLAIVSQTKRSQPAVHIETAAANLGTTPYWLRLNLRIVGDYVTRDQLQALGKRDRKAPLRGQAWQRHWRSRNYSPDVARRDDLLLPGSFHVAAAEKSLQARISADAYSRAWARSFEAVRI
jgi:hypothetical protein